MLLLKKERTLPLHIFLGSLGLEALGRREVQIAMQKDDIGSTRGFGVDETRQLTGWIADILDDLENEETIERVRNQVLELCARFPVYG
mgnify:CR=1 FL=1